MVRDDMLASYGISKEQLHADALASSAALLPAKVSHLSDEISRLSQCGRGEAEDGSSGSKMLVLSNSKNFFGAAALFYNGIMDLIAEMTGGSYFILPSSVNELILLPDDGSADPESLAALVRDVNRCVVRPDEWLSDNVYYYDAQTRQFRPA